MKPEKIEIRKLIADNGHVFAKPDKTEVYGNEMYLGCNDKAENYIEITEDEAKEIKAKQENTEG